MTDEPMSPDLNYAELTTEMVSAYVSHNQISACELPSVIHSVYAAILGMAAPTETDVVRPVPAVPIKKSITPDYIISLEDGRKFKSLKRTLTKLGMTPAEYRAKWSLPSDYPMVAANYAARPSELAKSIGLGQQRR